MAALLSAGPSGPPDLARVAEVMRRHGLVAGRGRRRVRSCSKRTEGGHDWKDWPYTAAAEHRQPTVSRNSSHDPILATWPRLAGARCDPFQGPAG